MKTGEIDLDVVNHWKALDISLFVRNQWQELKPKLDNKIRVYVGYDENYLLNLSVKLLVEEVKK